MGETRDKRWRECWYNLYNNVVITDTKIRLAGLEDQPFIRTVLIIRDEQENIYDCIKLAISSLPEEEPFRLTVIFIENSMRSNTRINNKNELSFEIGALQEKIRIAIEKKYTLEMNVLNNNKNVISSFYLVKAIPYLSRSMQRCIMYAKDIPIEYSSREKIGKTKIIDDLF